MLLKPSLSTRRCACFLALFRLVDLFEFGACFGPRFLFQRQSTFSLCVAGIAPCRFAATALPLALVLAVATVLCMSKARALPSTVILAALPQILTRIQAAANMLLAQEEGIVEAYRRTTIGRRSVGISIPTCIAVARTATAADDSAGHQSAHCSSRQAIEISAVESVVFHQVFPVHDCNKVRNCISQLLIGRNPSIDFGSLPRDNQ